jgi:predicted MFS family arabinose efflux permease
MYMGMVTMGITAGSATINLVMNTLFPKIGVSGFMYLFAGIAVVLIVLVLFSKNTPEEAGAYPDNDKSMTREKVLELRRMAEEYKKRSPWTTRKVLKTKQTWFVAIGWGLPMMAAVGVMTNLVGTIASYGHDYMYGITLLSTMWPAGVLGNYLGGVVDEKFGTKTATLMVVALELVGAFITLVFGADKILVAVGVALFMFAISACTNVCMSMTATVYGREDFENAWPVVQVIFRIIQVSGVLFIASIAEGISYKAALMGVIIIVAIGGVIVMLTSSEQIGSHMDDA